ncbi:hypothetical protein SAMN05518863_10246 [Candidatus Pantoea symbiotica]|uniref:Uncharacterized protein n=1 Tax=Candidatus Pantoea symbiotica TaxID=1884370 RepID=A0A1I3SPH1_9GAMM|nr:hypothetical protein SAMN05518863_10246 [Pantoea symbiotica]SFU55103.1 hypothetical protein SAMN05518864_102551 [Pantoea sp. YR525]
MDALTPTLSRKRARELTEQLDGKVDNCAT